MINGEDLTKDLGSAPTDTGYRIAVVLKALTNQYWQIVAHISTNLQRL